jgi:ATP adenylyltransferase
MVYQGNAVRAMPQEPCPFCSLDDSNRVFYRDDLVAAFWDGFPVSPGHALVVPRRHVAGWFESTPDEQEALMRALDAARAAILERHQPDGFNIGVNVGAAAGQTVFHLHVHLIPRYEGDVDDPRGGVRRLIPHKADYWSATEGEP